MSETYSVSLVALRNAVTHAGQISAAIDRLLTEMEGAVEGKLATWTGDGREAYRLRKAEWDQASARMPASLTAANQTLEAIAEQYDAAERAAIDAFFNQAG